MENVGNRIDYFERMLADNPDNPTGLLALANEYGKAERHEEEAAVLQRYVANHDDEGNAYARLGEVLHPGSGRNGTRPGRPTRRGISQAEKHGHSGMAEDLRLRRLVKLGDRGSGDQGLL